MSPPRLARLIARLLLPARTREFILGDLEELHAGRAERLGVSIADRRYWRDVLSLASARLRRGGPRGARSVRDAIWTPTPVRDLTTDLAAALRSIRRSPGFHAVVVLTLAVGVGSTATVFGMANQLLLRPLPGTTDPGGAAYLQLRSARNPESTQGQGLSYPDVETLRRSVFGMTGLASYGLARFQVSVGAERPIQVSAGMIYGDFFEVLGVRASSGRLIRPDETAIGAEEVRIAVLSEELRSVLFGPNEDVVGRTLQVNGEPVTVIGVAGGGFAGPARGDALGMWVPHPALVPLLDFPPETLVSRNSTMHSDYVVRLKEGVTEEAAEAEVGAILRRLAQANPEEAEYLLDLRPMLFPGLHIRPLMREATYRALRLLAGAVALVLLIACANVANLLLFRNVNRRGVLATRRALGASPGRVARQQLAESLVLAVLGAAAGIGAAWLISLPLRGESLGRVPAFEGFMVDWRVLGFAAILAAATAVLFGALPALLAGRFDLGPALGAAGGRETGRVAGLRWLMSASQVALSLTLLIGGLLLARTLRNLHAVDTGFDIEGVIQVPITPPRDADLAALEAWRQNLLVTVQRLPSVQAAALDMYGPHGPRMFGRIRVAAAADEEVVRANHWPVTPGWFELFDIGIRHGRTLREEDSTAEPVPIMVTASLARRLFGREDVVGRVVEAGFGEWSRTEIVGITGDLRSANTPDQADDAFFMALSAVPFPLPSLTLFVRTRSFDAGVAREIRSALEGMMPDLPMAEPTPLADRLTYIHSERRVFGRLLGLLSILALTLTAVGLYSVIAFGVAGRVREFGIRIALGARGSRIGRLVVRDAAGIVATGSIFGLVGAYALSALLESRLFGVQRVDPLSYGAAVVFFAAIATAACWSPAMRAMRVDPVKTLKAQ